MVVRGYWYYKPFLCSLRWLAFSICVFTFDFGFKIFFATHKPYGEGKLCYLWAQGWCDRNHFGNIKSFLIIILKFWCYQSLKTRKFRYIWRSMKRSLIEIMTSWKYLQHWNCSTKVRIMHRVSFCHWKTLC
jgi:hypothetical protein